MSESYVPRRLAEALARTAPARIYDRVDGLVPETARLLRAGRVAEAHAHWRWGVARITDEVIAELGAELWALEVAGSA